MASRADNRGSRRPLPPHEPIECPKFNSALAFGFVRALATHSLEAAAQRLNDWHQSEL